MQYEYEKCRLIFVFNKYESVSGIYQKRTFCVQEAKKMPYIPFTEEQKVTANSVNLADFLWLRDEKLERAGREYKLVYSDGSGSHDSITIRGST